MTERNSCPATSRRYEDLYNESVTNPEKFWAKIGDLLSWTKPWTKVLDNSKEPFTKWFVGGELNACYNTVDRHVEAGKGSKTALIYDSPFLGISKRISYLELQEKISRLAGALADIGVEKGDCVLIYMPVIPETVMAILATARLGAVHSVVFGGFAPCELCTRIENCKPKVIIAADCGIEPKKIVHYLNNVTQAMALCAHKPLKCIVYQRRNVFISHLDSEKFMSWDYAIQTSEPHECVSVEANEPLYILYTSGTTGQPKGVQRPIGGHLVALNWTMDVLYGLQPNDVWWSTSDFGWVVGHSYMCYAPLLYGMTSVIYEGKPTFPDPSQYFRIISEYKVNAMFTIPTALRVIIKEDSEALFGAEYDISCLRNIFVAGEHCDLSTKIWAERVFNVPVLNHWWQTETGHAITGTCVGLSQTVQSTKLTAGLPFPGFVIEVLREDGSKADTQELGRIVAKLPLPPGTFTTLYMDPLKFVDHYFRKYPGYYDTMDAGYVDEDGLVYVTARDDDVINVAGHRLSTLAIENIILSHPDVSEACVVSVPDEIKHEIPFCFFVTRNGPILEGEVIGREVVQMVRETMGPVAAFKYAVPIRVLPQTRSGKICRKAISDLARNKSIRVTGTVVDPSIFDEIATIFGELGFVMDNIKISM